MTKRERVSPEELVEILNEHLAEYDVCEGCQVRKPPLRLQEPDEEGVNWSRAAIQLDCSAGSAKVCQEIVPKVLADVAAQYNLTEK